ncbi:MAG: HlyD family efflux transporter periplasmic adaptor subunit [Xanthomonadales bacterium]|nr:HlyD family efflux transporter periplasmic adaptor subunit [Xanthomonadales bacterium]
MVDIHRPELKRQRKRRQWLYAAMAVAAAAVVGVAVFSLDPATPTVARNSVWTDTVRAGEFVLEVRGPGSLVPREIRWIPAASAGRVERILVKPGARVEADTVLVELSNPELVQAADEARWQAEAAEAEWQSLQAELDRQLLDARADFATVRADYESARLQAEAEGGLAKDGVVSMLQYRQSQLRADQLQVRVELEEQRIERLKASVTAQLAARRAVVEQANQLRLQRDRQVADLEIRAGIAGVLQQVPVEEGQQVQLGANVARVARPDELIAELRIAETQARDVQLDLPVRVDTRNGIVPGRVMRIDPAVQNGTVQVDVELTADLPAGARPDLSVDGTIVIERLSNVVFVGRPAYGQPDSTLSLFKVGADGEAQRVDVALGRASINLIEVRSGLVPGDLVVLSDTSAWDEYDAIRLE